MKIPKKSRRTYAKSLRSICKRLKLPFAKTKPNPARNGDRNG